MQTDFFNHHRQFSTYKTKLLVRATECHLNDTVVSTINSMVNDFEVQLSRKKREEKLRRQKNDGEVEAIPYPFLAHLFTPAPILLQARAQRLSEIRLEAAEIRKRLLTEPIGTEFLAHDFSYLDETSTPNRKRTMSWFSTDFKSLQKQAMKACNDLQELMNTVQNLTTSHFIEKVEISFEKLKDAETKLFVFAKSEMEKIEEQQRRDRDVAKKQEVLRQKEEDARKIQLAQQRLEVSILSSSLVQAVTPFSPFPHFIPRVTGVI